MKFVIDSFRDWVNSDGFVLAETGRLFLDGLLLHCLAVRATLDRIIYCCVSKEVLLAISFSAENTM